LDLVGFIDLNARRKVVLCGAIVGQVPIKRKKELQLLL
jgi:hypothetical protein